jgi:hypothetical protein
MVMGSQSRVSGPKIQKWDQGGWEMVGNLIYTANIPTHQEWVIDQTWHNNQVIVS